MGGYGARSGRCGSAGRLSEEGRRSPTGAGISNRNACTRTGCGSASDKRHLQRAEYMEDLCYPRVCRVFWGTDTLLHVCLSLAFLRMLYS